MPAGVRVFFSVSVVLDKDVSRPITISLADLIPYISFTASESFYIGDDSESADTAEEIAIGEECIEAELKDA